MKVVTDLRSLAAPEQGTSVAIGTFDGVHLGHRALIERARKSASELGTIAGVVTWDRHPAATLRPDKAPGLLTSTERKVELLGTTGIELLVLIAFDEAFSQLSPASFVSEVLVARAGVRSVHVGHDWHFGRGAAGDLDALRGFGAEHGFSSDGVDLLVAGEEPVTSSRIRRAIADGRVGAAAALLGRPHDVDGEVVHGESRGRSLGFPTANVDVAPGLVRPAVGIYAGVVTVSGRRYAAAISVGTNPTFGAGTQVRVEAYLLDFDGSIYGERVRLEFHRHLRSEQAFETPEALIAQMEADVAATREAIGEPNA